MIIARGGPAATDHAEPTSTSVVRKPVVALLLFGVIAAYAVTRWLSFGAASLYGIAVFGILGTKLWLSLLPARRWHRPSPATRVGVVVTVYNEDPELLRRCLRSLQDQRFPPTRIVVVDDASPELASYAIAREMSRTDQRVTVFRQPSNLGKREALARGFLELAGDVDVFLCVDSDSVLDPQAIYEGLRPFTDRRTTAATGLVLPLNHDENVLTRLQDVRYTNAFLGERAAYSRFGSVLCVCGILAFYRADVVLENLDDFLTQRFLGRPAVTGDDRRLTNYCLVEGDVVFVETAIAHTAVPERFGHFIRQQARWGRSFFRESLWVLRHRNPMATAWWLTLLEVAQWAAFSALLTYLLVVHPLLTGQWLLWEYVWLVGLMAAARAVRYFDIQRPAQTRRSRFLTFTTAPLYGFLNLLVMLPLRFYSLVTLHTTAWGTRAAVEVTAAERTVRAPVTRDDPTPLTRPTPSIPHEMNGPSGRGRGRPRPRHARGRRRDRRRHP